MMPQLSLKEHRERLAEKRHAAAGVDHAVAAVHQAAISAKHLTGDKHWDVFLQYLGAEMNRLRDIEETSRSVLESVSVVDTERLLQAKMVMVSAIRARETLEAVIALPKDIIERGEDAASIEQRLGKEE